MKKHLSILLTLSIMVSFAMSMPVHAKVGDVIGQAYNTDIVAYINNYAIPSYAVNGQSCIVAEDLKNFGFDVTWNDSTRSLTISRNSDVWPKLMKFSKSGVPSTKFADLLETDISVYANGKKLTSYAINGYTMIPIEELNVFGSCNWVESERAIKLWVDGLHIRYEKQSVEQTVTPSASTSTTTTATTSNYYPGFDFKTYTAVTGVALKRTENLDNGGTVYIYPNTTTDDIGKYWSYLASKGCVQVRKDDKSTRTVFECAFATKDLKTCVMNYVYLGNEEIWIVLFRE